MRMIESIKMDMKGIFLKTPIKFFFYSILFFIVNSLSCVYARDLFSITGFGTAIQPVPVELCLNGVAKVSCQRYYFDHFAASIVTTIPNKTYVQAGIRIDDSRYDVASQTGCQSISNGFCIFTVSNTVPSTIIITDYILNISPSSLTSYATRTYPYTSPLISASGGTPPYVYTVTGNLPNGITPNYTEAGVVYLSGTSNSKAGSYTFKVAATDASQAKGEQIYTLTLSNPLSFTPSYLPEGQQDQPYLQVITPSGGTAPYTIQLSSGTLPKHLQFIKTTTDATILGKIASTGELGPHPLTVSAVDANNVQGRIDYNLLVRTTLSISYTQSPASSESTDNIIVVSNLDSNTVYFAATGGTGTLTYTLISSSTVPGSFDQSTGKLTLPIGTTTGKYQFIIKAETNNGDIGYHLYDLIVYTEPTLTSIDPTSGPNTGEQKVTISGTDFSAYPNTSGNPTIVTFGSTPATSVVVDSTNNTITCITPGGTAGTTVDVTVSNTSAPTLSKTLRNAYTYHQVSAQIDLSSYANMWGIFNTYTNYGGYSSGLSQYYSFFPTNTSPFSNITTSATYSGQTMSVLPSASSSSDHYNVIYANEQNISFGLSAGTYNYIYMLQTGVNLSYLSSKSQNFIFILHYLDGTSTQQTVCVSDWGYNACPNQTVVMYSSARGYCEGSGCNYSFQSYQSWNILGITIPVDSSKTLTSIELPSFSAASNYYRLFSIT
ncbi:MAG: hypothetical protein EBQ95_07025, partial [Gammaproteobacteria bacterium]|nr:hypothetical protein [Gammaproteobacteria bacterium]